MTVLELGLPCARLGWQGVFPDPRIDASCVTLIFQRNLLQDDNATVGVVPGLALDGGGCFERCRAPPAGLPC
jgi:hypothetical protein